MPFTPAHIVAVIPFRKRIKSIYFTSLVVGSIIPDMEYFLRFNPASGFSHTIKGIFLFDVPLALLFLWLWQLYLRRAFVDFVPYLKTSPQEASVRYSVKEFIVIVVCIIAGTCTHLLWDAFTHGKGYFVLKSEWLQSEVLFGAVKGKVCYLLWYLCSIVGSIIFILTFFSFRKKKNATNKTAIQDFWSKVLFLALMLAVIRISMGLSHNVPRHLVIIIIGAFIYAFGLIAFTENIQNKKGRNDPA